MTEGLTQMPGVSDFRVWTTGFSRVYSPRYLNIKCTGACFRGTMDKLRICERNNQVSIVAADRLEDSVFDDREDTQALPAFNSGCCGVQVALFILR